MDWSGRFCSVHRPAQGQSWWHPEYDEHALFGLRHCPGRCRFSKPHQPRDRQPDHLSQRQHRHHVRLHHDQRRDQWRLFRNHSVPSTKQLRNHAPDSERREHLCGLDHALFMQLARSSLHRNSRRDLQQPRHQCGWRLPLPRERTGWLEREPYLCRARGRNHPYDRSESRECQYQHRFRRQRPAGARQCHHLGHRERHTPDTESARQQRRCQPDHQRAHGCRRRGNECNQERRGRLDSRSGNPKHLHRRHNRFRRHARPHPQKPWSQRAHIRCPWRHLRLRRQSHHRSPLHHQCGSVARLRWNICHHPHRHRVRNKR